METEKEIKKWVGELPKSELDIPLVVIDDRAYTPNEVLSQIRSRTGLGKRMVSLDIKTIKTIPAEEQMQELAKIRLKMKLEKTPPKFAFGRYILGEKETYTAEEMIAEIQMETPVGEEFISTEKTLMRDLQSR